MITGIYKLVFKGTNKVYIGQSTDCNTRFSKHKMYLKKGTAAAKLQEAYNIYGMPTLEILCECSKHELNTFENETIEIYNSVDNGFNSYDAARGNTLSTSGTLHYNSKYSKEQIVQVFFAILDPSTDFKEISKATGVSLGSINVLSRGSSHKYLKYEYPKEYDIMLSLIGERRKYVNSSSRLGKQYPTIVSPEGVEYYNIGVVADFAKKHGLDVTGLRHVLNKARNRTTVGGWTLKEYMVCHP